MYISEIYEYTIYRYLYLLTIYLLIIYNYHIKDTILYIYIYTFNKKSIYKMGCCGSRGDKLGSGVDKVVVVERELGLAKIPIADFQRILK